MRDATLDLLRERRLTRIFANPGSTEVPFLTGFPDDFEFVLGLHEGAVVGMATGFAIAKDEPALVMLHTTAGLGNAVGSLATARVTCSCRNARWSPKIVFETPSLPSTCSAAGVNSMSPSGRWNVTAMCPASFVMPSSW